MADSSICIPLLLCISVVLRRSAHRSFCSCLGAFYTFFWRVDKEEIVMLQIIVFSIGLVIFWMAIVGGILVFNRIDYLDQESANK